ncbi:MAG: hypothetical protein M3315_08295 [Actinomycetota bacterium]|nr:hypothetical protein [Actinomycetota bacterium]
MPYRLTTRSRSIDYSGTLSAGFTFAPSRTGPQGNVQVGPFTVSFGPVYETGTIFALRGYYLLIEAGGLTLYRDQVPTSIGFPGPTGSQQISGAFSAHCDVCDLIDSQGMSPRIYEGLLPGSVATCQASFGVLSGSVSWPVTPDRAIEVGGINAHVEGIFFAVAQYAEIQAHANYSTGEVISLGVPLSHTYNSTAGGVPVSWTLSCNSGPRIYAPDGVGGGYVWTFNDMDGGYDLQGRVFAMKDPYPNNIDLDVTTNDAQSALHTDTITASPDFSRSDSRSSYSGVLSQSGNYYDTNNYTSKQAGIQQVSLKLDSQSVLSLQEDPTDPTVLMHGPAFDAFALQQDVIFSVDDGSSLTPPNGIWTYNGGAISSTGGAIRADSHGMTNPLVTRTWTSGKEAQLGSYRFLRIRLRVTGAANAPITLKVYSQLSPGFTSEYKVFTLTSGADGAWVTRDVDLCSPAQWGLDDPFYGVTPYGLPTVDTQQSKYPRNSVKGAYWGLQDIWKLTVAFPGETVLEIDDISSAQQNSPTVSMLPGVESVPGSVNFHPTSASLATVRPAFRALTDGKASLEEVDRASAGASVNTSIIGLVFSVNQVVNAQPQNPGWKATPLALYGDYVSLNMTAQFLGGAGVLYNGGWDVWQDKGLGVIPAQPVYTSLRFSAGLGDVFGWSDGHYGGNILLKAAKVLYGASEGIVLDVSGAPANAVTVEARRSSDNALAGSSVTDILGRYETGSPFGRGKTQHKLRPLPEDVHILDTAMWQTHWRRRASFRVVPVSGAPTNLHDVSGAYHRALEQSGDLYYYLSDHATPPWDLTNVRVTANGSNSDPSIAERFDGRLYLVFTHSGDVYQTLSDQRGESWSTPTLILSGATKPRIAEAEGTLLIVAQGSSLVGTVQGQGDPNPSTSFTLADETGTPISVTGLHDITHMGDPQGRWLLACVPSGESATVVFRGTDNGRTWRRLSGYAIGGDRPRIAARDGYVLHTAVVGGTLTGVYHSPGMDPSAPFSTQNQAGSALRLANVAYDISPSRDQQGRWVLTCVLEGDTKISELWSSDEGHTWRAV